jgi:hypothetical protein
MSSAQIVDRVFISLSLHQSVSQKGRALPLWMGRQFAPLTTLNTGAESLNPTALSVVYRETGKTVLVPALTLY